MTTETPVEMSEVITEPIPEYLSITDYADHMGVDRSTVYKKLKTEETPDGPIEPFIDENNVWKIHWPTYKNFVFQKKRYRSKGGTKASSFKRKPQQ